MIREPLLSCADCKRSMRPADPSGLCQHRSRGLCHSCFRRAERAGTVDDFPRFLHRSDDVLDEWVEFRGRVSFVEFADRVGMTLGAWERMFLRARKAGDPRAVRDSARRSA